MLHCYESPPSNARIVSILCAYSLIGSLEMKPKVEVEGATAQ